MQQVKVFILKALIYIAYLIVAVFYKRKLKDLKPGTMGKSNGR